MLSELTGSEFTFGFEKVLLSKDSDYPSFYVISVKTDERKEFSFIVENLGTKKDFGETFGENLIARSQGIHRIMTSGPL